MMWPGVEPARGKYNYTYLEVARNITSKLVIVTRNTLNVQSFTDIVYFTPDPMNMAYIPYWTCTRMHYLPSFVEREYQTGLCILAVRVVIHLN